MSSIKDITNKTFQRSYKFLRTNWIGTIVILLATLIFFWPIVTRIGTYSMGGDAMFNAWTLARDQHCILQQHCSSYADGNIFFPNKYSMLYSETQLSAGFLTLPFYFINQNPIFSYNMWTIISFFMAGWFMYLLAKYLSKGNELFSTLAGLAFAFAPTKIAGVTHLQNLSIFYLPLIVLLIIKYLKSPAHKYLAGLFISATLMFYASWYQMAFALLAVGVLLFAAGILKITRWKPIIPVLITLSLAVIVTLPLVREYVKFSKVSGATYSIGDQNKYSASLADYFIPYQGTYEGDIYYGTHTNAQVNSYGPDGVSYAGFALYITALIIFALSFIKRKQHKDWNRIFKWTTIFIFIATAGFIISLGPFLKLGGSHLYHTGGKNGVQFAIALPYLIVGKLLPQLNFIRAVGRAGVLVLFGLCCVLSFAPVALNAARVKKATYYGVSAILAVLIFVEFYPTHGIAMSSNPYYYNMNIPKVYRYIHDRPEVDRIVVLAPDNDYPGQKFLPKPFLNGVFEQVLWAGYDNKDTFNGYSGYFPPNYDKDMADFNDFQANDIKKMRDLGLRYILVDKLLASSNPSLAGKITNSGPDKIYQDDRYILFKI